MAMMMNWLVGCTVYKWPACHRGNEEVFVGGWFKPRDWSGVQNIALVHVRACQPALHNPAITPTDHGIISPQPPIHPPLQDRFSIEWTHLEK